eukprot:7992969-Alexandrium_andersonii.AAC.1
MTVEEMLSMRDIMSQCWRAFLQLASAGADMVAEGEVLDLTATQAMELDPLPSNLRRTPTRKRTQQPHGGREAMDLGGAAGQGVGLGPPRQMADYASRSRG